MIDIDHLGSAHTDAELALLLATAQERMAPGQGMLDVGDVCQVAVSTTDIADWTSSQGLSSKPVDGRRATVPAGVRLLSTSATLLWDVLTSTYTFLGFDVLDDEAFRAMVLARIIEPTSKADTVRVLNEIGAPAPSLRTLFRSQARCQDRDYRGLLAKAAMAHSVRTTGRSGVMIETRGWFSARWRDCGAPFRG